MSEPLWARRLPRVIKVGAVDYTMRLMDPESDPADTLLGQHDIDRKIIWINPKQDGLEVRDTLLHELLHALWARFRDEKGKKVAQEPMVSRLATGLAMVFRDNPDLVSWLRVPAGKGRA